MLLIITGIPSISINCLGIAEPILVPLPPARIAATVIKPSLRKSIFNIITYIPPFNKAIYTLLTCFLKKSELGRI